MMTNVVDMFERFVVSQEAIAASLARLTQAEAVLAPRTPVPAPVKTATPEPVKTEAPAPVKTEAPAPKEQSYRPPRANTEGHPVWKSDNLKSKRAGDFTGDLSTAKTGLAAYIKKYSEYLKDANQEQQTAIITKWSKVYPSVPFPFGFDGAVAAEEVSPGEPEIVTEADVPAPEEGAPVPHTIDDCQAALKLMCQFTDFATAVETLNEFGVGAVRDLPQASWTEFIERCSEIVDKAGDK